MNDNVRTYWPVAVVAATSIWAGATLSNDVSRLKEADKATVKALAQIAEGVRENRENNIVEGHNIKQILERQERLYKLIVERLTPAPK